MWPALQIWDTEFTSCAKKKSEPVGPSPVKSGQVRPPPTSLPAVRGPRGRYFMLRWSKLPRRSSGVTESELGGHPSGPSANRRFGCKMKDFSGISMDFIGTTVSADSVTPLPRRGSFDTRSMKYRPSGPRTAGRESEGGRRRSDLPGLDRTWTHRLGLFFLHSW